MTRYDLFSYKKTRNYLINRSNDIEAEREKLYHTTPSYEEKFGNGKQDRLAEDIIAFIEKQDYYSEELKTYAKKLKEIETKVYSIENVLYKNILYLKYLSPEDWTLRRIWEEDKLGSHYSDEKYVSDIHRKALEEFER